MTGLATTTDAAVPDTGLRRSRRRKRPSLGRGLAIVLAVVASGLFLTAAGNYALSPLTYSRGAQEAAASTLAAGRAIAISDANVDWRELRREHLQRMGEKPDIIIFGGSRWQEATAEVAPGRRFYNAFVSNDHFEDMPAVTELLRATNKLPKTLVLSVRFSTFEFLERRDSAWWKSFGPEYRAMAERLGVQARPWAETLPWDKWLHLLSLDMLFTRAAAYWSMPVSWRPADALSDPQLDTVGPDGALRFSQRHLDVYSPAAAQKDAEERAALHRGTRLRIDAELLPQLAALIRFLKQEGVQVVFAQTPFHPAYYAGIQSSPYFDDLMAIERELNRIAAAEGALVAGSFDARQEGCAEADYRDFNHARVQCLERIVRRIPGI